MLIKARLFEHYNTYDFSIPLKGGESIKVKTNQNVSPGDLLFTKEENRIKESYFLIEELNCKIKDCPEYVKCIDGEYIGKGEILAQKKSKNGLTLKQVISGKSGIVDLDRLKEGFIDILSEEEKTEVQSQFIGVIKDILPGSYIQIKSCVSALDLVGTTLFEEKIFGEVVLLTDDEQVLSSIPDIDLKDRVVWAGPYLPNNLALKIFKKGAKAIIAYSMEYDDFKNFKLPIAVIEGFGNIHCSEIFLKEINKLENKFVIIDPSEKQLFAIKDKQKQSEKDGFFVKELLGATVISRHSAHYGYIGTVVQVNDLNYVTVDFGKSGKSIVDIGSLDFISF
jgi:hypothetical protein